MRFFNESAFGSARGAHHPPTRTSFASPINSLPTRVDPVPIGPIAAELSSRDWNRVWHFSHFPRTWSRTLPMLRLRGKCRFSRTRHAPVLHTSEPVPRLTSGPQRHLGRVQISAPHSRPFRLRGFANDATLRADRQRERVTE